MKTRLFALWVMVFLAAGCAGVSITKVTPVNSHRRGIRFYRPHPYLWVTKDKEGSLQGVIIWLPDKNEEYVIKVKSGLGSTDLKFKLENGWNLVEFGEVRDSKIPETITALTGSSKAAEGVAPGVQGLIAGELLPGLYKFVFNPNTGLVSKLVPIVQFKR